MKLRRTLSCMMALLLVCSLPVSALADTYDLAQGSVTVNASESGQTVTHGTNDAVSDDAPVIIQSNNETPTTNTITITATENATANVTIQDVNIVISDPVDDPKDHRGEAAVTIDVADGAEANVTLDSVKIDVGGTGGLTGEYIPGEAAVQSTGNGDVTVELDGEAVEDDYSLVAVCNGRYYGGGFMPMPEARMNDGVLNTLVVKKISRAAFAKFVGAYAKGEYHKFLHLAHCSTPQVVRIRSQEEDIVTCLDGECITSNDVTIRLSDKKLNFFGPEGCSCNATAR